MKIANFWRKIASFYQLSEWNGNSQYVTLLYSRTFYSLFLPFFVLEIFKFKYDKVFVRNSASISKFKWFEQPWYIAYHIKLAVTWILKIWIRIYFCWNNQPQKTNIIVGTIYRHPKMDVTEYNNILNNIFRKKLIKNKRQCFF